MTTEADLSRGRRVARQALAELDGLSQRQADCGDDTLRSTLRDISQRKSGQAWRMMAWLQQHDNHPPSSQRQLAPAPQQPDQSSAPAEPGPSVVTDSVTETPSFAATFDAAPVIERRDVTADLIVFRVARPEGFQFSPGQSVKVGLGDIRRSYSIVSAPHEPFLEFFVELAPGGQMSERLRQLQAGDTLSLGNPKGGLRFDDRVQSHLMIATVTGINPFISILRDYLHRGQHEHGIVLMHGASYQDEFGYRQELEALAAAHPDLLTYLPTISRPDEPRNQGWMGATGRVDTLVEDVLSNHGLTPENSLAYACGHSGMLESVAGQLQPRGFRLETESYD
ncbi:ferredoxin--NADP reductase [Marinobacter lacisalsi]|uniref:ferredoxin--NADP(+) reductase n=1 Tax=Marinobacter lacisalsi TaxID=475979 RepID=A0ABV8QCR9_9GAMM